MASAYCFYIKVEFENTWPDILSEKIADLATVERVEQSPSLAHDELVCIKYDSGFFMFYGWLREEMIVIIRPTDSKTTDKKKHKAVLERITEIFDEMKDRDWGRPMMKEDDHPISHSMTVTQKMIIFLLLFLCSLVFAIFMVVFGFA